MAMIGALAADAFFARIQLSVSFGLLLGSWAALKRNRLPDTLGMGVASALMSVPSLWLGMLPILLLAMIFPIFDVVSGPEFCGLALPSVTLAPVFMRHLLRNALLLRVLTVVGLQVGNRLSGAVVVETVFPRTSISAL